MAQNNPPQSKKSLFGRGLSLLMLAGALLSSSVTGTAKTRADKNETDKEISIVSYTDVKNSLIENEALAKTAKRIGIPKKKFANMKFGLAKCETPSIGKNFAVQGNPNSSAENLWQMVSKTYRDYGRMIGYSDSTLNASRLSTDSAALQVNNTIQMLAFEDNYRLAQNKIRKFREDGIDSLTVTGKKDKYGVLQSRTIALDDDLAPLCLTFAYHAGAGNVDAQLDKGTKDSTGKKLTASLLLPKLGNQNFFPHFNVPFTYGGELDLIKPKKKHTVVTQVKSMLLPYSQGMVALSNALENHDGIDSDNVAVIKMQEPRITKKNRDLLENNNVHHYPSPPQEASENPVKDRSIAAVSGGDVPCQTLGENDIQLKFVTNKKDVFSDAFKEKYMNQKMTVAGKEYDITEQFFANFGSVYGHASAMIFTNAYNRQSKNESGKDALSDKTKLAKHLNALEENKIYPIYSNLSGFPSIG